MFARPFAARIPLFAALVLFALSVPVLAEETAEFHDPYRLDPIASPTSQSVELKLDPGQRTYSGSTRIEMVLHEDSDRFQIHAFEMDIRQTPAELVRRIVSDLSLG